MMARCMARRDGPGADRLAGRVEAFARERSILSLQVDAQSVRGLIAQDLNRLEEATQLASRIGSLWILASVSHVRHRILRSRSDDAATAREQRSFLAHLSILSADLDPKARTALADSIERGVHPFVI